MIRNYHLIWIIPMCIFLGYFGRMHHENRQEKQAEKTYMTDLLAIHDVLDQLERGERTSVLLFGKWEIRRYNRQFYCYEWMQKTKEKK